MNSTPHPLPKGSVSDMDLTVSNRQPEFIAIAKQSYDDVVHLDRFGKANGLAR